jgi:hypothetical protein
MLDDGSTNAGLAFIGTLQRTGLGVVGRKRNGEWIVDFTKQKILRRVWVKGSGGPITIRAGAAQTPQGAILWSAPKTLDLAHKNYVDVIAVGKALAVEFKSDVPFRLQGYKLEMADSMARF